MISFQQFLYIAIFIGVIVLLYQLYKLAFDSPYRISSEEAKKRIASHEIDVILDVRTELERNTLGFYPNSLHMSSDRLQKDFPRAFPNKATKILIYCNTGQRARVATDTLHSMGYTNTVYISGSYLSLL